MNEAGMPDKRSSDEIKAPSNAHIYKTIRRRICTTEYPPGAVIYETELAAEFGISRTPIRAILSRLARDGLLETKRGLGNTITRIDYSSFQDAYKLRIHLAKLIGEFADVSRIAEVVADFESLREMADRLRDTNDYLGIGEINLGILEGNLKLIEGTALREVTEILYLRTTRVWHLAIPHLNWVEEVDCVKSEIADSLKALSLGDVETFGHVRRNFIAMAFRRIGQYPQLFHDSGRSTHAR